MEGTGSVLHKLVTGFTEDLRAWSLTTACARAARTTWFAFSDPQTLQTLLADPSCHHHVKTVAPKDALFFASHRAYLARGLGPRARGLAALTHYRNETVALDTGYHEAVYDRGELPIWRRKHRGTVFEIRLMPGNDVLFEGGLSLTFFVDDHRIAVLSYSNIVPSVLQGGRLSDGPTGPLVPFVTRRQSSFHAYRCAFTAAFGRGTPGHLCLAALEGIALAQGSRELRGISADHHPAGPVLRPDGSNQLDTMYDDFWRSLSGERTCPLAWVIPLPLQPTPLEALNSHNRRRALRLRRHQAAVRDSAFRTYRSHLLRPPPVDYQPAMEPPAEPEEEDTSDAPPASS